MKVQNGKPDKISKKGMIYHCQTTLPVNLPDFQNILKLFDLVKLVESQKLSDANEEQVQDEKHREGSMEEREE